MDNNEIQAKETVYMAVTPDARTDAAMISSRGYDKHDFNTFIQLYLDRIKDSKGPIPDSWLFSYEIPKSQELSRKSVVPCYFAEIRNMAAEYDIHPQQIIPMRDALYCKEYQLELFSPQTQHGRLVNAPGYRALSTRFGIYANESPDAFRTCRAVDTGKGVLLYDLSQAAGREAYDSLLQHCADHFFDTGFDVDKLRFYELHTFLDPDKLEANLGATNFNFNHRGRDYTFKDLTASGLYGSDLLREGILIKEYDMKPTSENYSLFLTGEPVRFNAGTRTFDIAILDHIARSGYPTERLSSEWNFICSYTSQFKDLADQIVLCTEPDKMQELQKEARIRARQFLVRDFPDIRQNAFLPSKRIDIRLTQEQIRELTGIQFSEEENNNKSHGHRI